MLGALDRSEPRPDRHVLNYSITTLAGKTIPTGAFGTPAIVRLRHAWHSCVADCYMIQLLIKCTLYDRMYISFLRFRIPSVRRSKNSFVRRVSRAAVAMPRLGRGGGHFFKCDLFKTHFI